MRVVFGAFVLDADTRQLLRDGHEVHLSPKSFDLLSTLIGSRPKALSKDQLQETLWPQSFVSEGNLSVLVSEIRHALDDDPGAPRFVRTVPRFGYAFVAETHHDAPRPTLRSPWSSPAPAVKIERAKTGATIGMGARMGRRAVVLPRAVVPAGTTVPPGATFP